VTRAPDFSEIRKKEANKALLSRLPACRLAVASQCKPGGLPGAGAWSPPPQTPTNAALSPTAPRAPGTPLPTTDGTRRTPGKAHAAPPAAPPAPARRRAGLPRPPPSPPLQFPSPPKHAAPRGRPGAAGISSAPGLGGTHAAAPRPWPWGEQPGRLAGCSPHATPTLSPPCLSSAAEPAAPAPRVCSSVPAGSLFYNLNSLPGPPAVLVSPF